MRISSEVRRLGGKAVGSRGSGKTLYAVYQTYCDFLNGVGTIAIDPMGSFTDYLFNRIAEEGDRKLWDRVVYVPLGGMQVGTEAWVVPTPLLFSGGEFEALQDRTQRVVDLWKRLSPQQESAPIQGMPSIEATADHLGMLLAAMGKQFVPDAVRMLEHTADWLPWCEAVAREHPYELASPLETVRMYADPKFSRRDERNETLSFLRQIGGAALNPRLSAQYGANEWGVNLKDVEAGKLIVFDCSGLKRRSEKKLASMWIFSNCMELFDARKPRRDCISFVVDELSYLVPKDNTLLEDNFEDLIMRISRNYGVSCFFTYQKVTQPSERMQEILDELGYSLFGSTSDAKAAAKLVELLDTFKPFWEKTSRMQYAPRGMDDSYDQEITQYYPPLEQDRMNQFKHRNRKGLHFAVTYASGEGAAATYKGECNIRSIQASQNFDKALADQAKARLVKTHGRRVSDVMTEIADRQPQATRSQKRQRVVASPRILTDAPPQTPMFTDSGEDDGPPAWIN